MARSPALRDVQAESDLVQVLDLTPVLFWLQEMDQPLKLASGVTLPNRIVKSALSETLANPLDNAPNEQLFTLYNQWATGRPAILVTGNVMVRTACCYDAVHG